MSWAALVKGMTTSSKSTWNSSEIMPSNHLQDEERASSYPSSHSQIRSASLQECWDYRSSGHREADLMYPGVEGKATLSVQAFHRRYRAPLLSLYQQLILPWAERMGKKIPSWTEFVTLAWVFSR